MTTFDQKRAAELLPIFTALAEGKTIEVRGPDGGWYKFDALDFDLGPEDYRVWQPVNGATFRLAVLSYLTGKPNSQGYLNYVACITDPAAEHGIETRPNFVRWLGDRTELLIGGQR